MSKTNAGKKNLVKFLYYSYFALFTNQGVELTLAWFKKEKKKKEAK